MHSFILQFSVFILVAFSSLPAYTQINSEVKNASLKTPNLYLEWGGGSAAPTKWQTNLGDDDWYSIIPNVSSGISRHLSVTGSLQNDSVSFEACYPNMLDSSTNSSSNKVSCVFQCDNFEIKQEFSKNPNAYHLNVSLTLINRSIQNYTVLNGDNLVLSLGPGFGEYDSQSVERSMYYYVEPIALSDGDVFKYEADTLKAGKLPWNYGKLKWAGLHNRYFTVLILPADGYDTNIYLPFSEAFIDYRTFNVIDSSPAHDLPLLSFHLPISSLNAGDSIRWDLTIFSGPKSYSALHESEADLGTLLFSDLWFWMRWLCLGLYHMLAAIYYLIPNWGWAIICLALVVRVLLYPFANKAQKSQGKFIETQKMMRPELIEIKEKYKGGEQSERILQLYKKYKISPFAGLKPLLVVLLQLPILIALFHVLGDVFELREAGFLWIKTLAEPDQLFSFGITLPFLGEYFNLLPLIMAAVTLATFKLSPAPVADKKDQKTQNLFLIAMTLMFFFIFYSFPAGMVLYWTFANVFQIVQQKLNV